MLACLVRVTYDESDFLSKLLDRRAESGAWLAFARALYSAGGAFDVTPGSADSVELAATSLAF